MIPLASARSDDSTGRLPATEADEMAVNSEAGMVGRPFGRLGYDSDAVMLLASA